MDKRISGKHPEISEDIRKEIKSGKYNDKIPSLQELARIYNVSITTAGKAVNSLVEENILYRKKGKGTFVCDGSEPKRRCAGMFMYGSGHIYGEMARSIQAELQRHNFLPVMIDFSTCDEKEILGKIENVFTLCPEVVIFQATYNAVGLACAEYFRKNASRIPKLIIVNSPEGAYGLKANYVLHDDWQGAYMMTEHLLKLGHRRIVYLSHHITVPPEYRRFSEGFQKELGYKMAMEEHNLKPEIVYMGNDEDVISLEAMLKDKGRPTAFFACQDNRAVNLLKIIQKLGLHVPDDVSLAGYFNTPWSEVTTPPLTTVSIHEDRVGKVVIEQILGSDKVSERYIDEPELVIRESTAACP